MKKLKFFSYFGLILLSLSYSLPSRGDDLNPQQALEIATEAYIYGYPLITMETTRRVMTNTVSPQNNHAPMGQFYNAPNYPDASFRDVTAPNADTLYSVAWLDLSKEPYVFSIPEEDGRYFLMPMLDAWTNVFASPGTRTSGTGPQKYAITGPNWTGTLPQDVKEIKSPTSIVWILGRTYCSGTPEDYNAVHAIQAQYHLIPLSAYGKNYNPPAGKVDPGIDIKTPVRDQVNRMDIGAYFKLLAELMKNNPPTPADAPIVAKMAKLGIVPGQDFDLNKLDANLVKTLQSVPQKAQEKIMSQSKSETKINSWIFSTKTGSYGTDYLNRAYVSAIGLGANLPKDAIYPVSEMDSTGQAYSGSNKYTIHFDKGSLPPVNGFWSLTMYNAQFFFIANPLNRYNLSSRSDFTYNADGSLDLYIQKDSPGKDKEANWLPAPEGNFILMLRLYWPKESVLDGSWKPPLVTKVTP